MKKDYIDKFKAINNQKLTLRFLSVLILVLFCEWLPVRAGEIETQQVKISLTLKNVSLTQAFNEIEKKSDFVFALADDVGKEALKKVSVDFSAASIEDILKKVLENTNLTYKMLEKQIVIYRNKEQLSTPVAAVKEVTQANTTIKGRVTDRAGEPIIGASVRLKGQENIGTITDIEGYFTLNVPRNAVLLISYVGYKQVDYPVKTPNNIKIVMSEDTELLNEVVVVGYSSQKKETLTGSIATLDNKELVASTTANLSNSLVGRVPGIVANQASGEAGDNASTIRIRGVATLNDGGKDPLIVIDGVQSTIETMNALDPNEISSISVLKDASSTAVYGVKGANGVIIVSTRRGSLGAPKISLSYRYGVTQLTSKLKMLNSYQYALFRNEAIRNDMEPGNYSYLFTDDELWKFQNNRDYTPEEVANLALTPAQKEALLNSEALYYGSHDYYNEQFGALSPQQQYNINISGGTDRMKYFVSLGAFNQLGVFKNAEYEGADVNSKYNRYNVRSNLDIDIHKNLKLSVDFGGQFEEKQGILDKDGSTESYNRHKEMLVNILCNPPYVGPGMVDGKLVSSFSKYNNPLSGKGASGFSPIANLLTREVLQNKTSNINMTARLDHSMDYLTEGLSLSGTISYSDVYTKGTSIRKWVPTYSACRNPENPSEILLFGGAEQPTTVSDNVHNNKWNRLYLEAKINYSRTFGKHAVTGLLLYNVQTTRYPGLQYNVPSNLIGTAGRFTYRYDERYLAEFNMGYNGSENFPEGKRFGFFPAYSLGWIVSNESFFPKHAWVSWLKLRGSYGEVGNDQIGGRRFLYLPSTWQNGGNYIGGGYYFGNTNGSAKDPYYTGASESVVGNPDVTWERAKKLNAGIDLYMFENRLTLVADYFHEKRDNILWNLGTVPSIVAATLAPTNIGKVSNKGYELTIGWSDKIRDFNYSISGNVSYADNKIEYMDEPSHPYEWMNTTGFSLGQYKGFRTDGFYNNQQEASNRPYIDLDGNHVRPGDIRYIDIDGDGVINAQDRTPIGYSNLPKFTFGSTINLEYKGFSLSVLFTGSYKGSLPMTSFYILNPFYMVNGNALEFQYDGRWTPEKAEQGITPTFPRASVRTYDSQNGAMNELWLRSTQFFRLKNVEIGYNFTKLGKLKKIGMSGIRVFVNGNNLYTWGSKLIDGYDPEQLDSGGATDGYLYPPTRTYNFGVNVQF